MLPDERAVCRMFSPPLPVHALPVISINPDVINELIKTHMKAGNGGSVRTFPALTFAVSFNPASGVTGFHVLTRQTAGQAPRTRYLFDLFNKYIDRPGELFYSPAAGKR